MKTSSRSLLLPLVLVVAALVWRIAKLRWGMNDVLPNFAPWVALAFAGAAVLPKQTPWWLWSVLLLAVDAVCHPQDIQQMWLVYVCLGGSALLGATLRSQPSVLRVLGGTVLCSLAFYLITSTQAWLSSPVYAKTITGWLQALTIGDPHYQPQAWVFGLRSLLSDAGFALMLVLAYNGEAKVRSLLPMPVAA